MTRSAEISAEFNKSLQQNIVELLKRRPDNQEREHLVLLTA